MYALDAFLRGFGLWPKSFRKLSDSERAQAIGKEDISKPSILNRAAFDPQGNQLITFTSHSSFDPKAGIFDDKIIYWRYRPWDKTDGSEEGPLQDQYVLQIRAILNPPLPPSEIPRLVPEQVWWNGSQIFDGPAHGGPHNPYRPEYSEIVWQMIELSKRVKERLRTPSAPLEEVGEDFYAAAKSMDAAKAITGSATSLPGLNNKGWDPIDSGLYDYFTRAVQKDGHKPVFSLPAIKAASKNLAPGAAKGRGDKDISPEARLHVLNGYYHNTVDPSLQMMEDKDEPTTSLESGNRYLASTDYSFDKKTGRHIYRHIITPQKPLDGSPVPAPFDIARLEYSQKGHVFTLEDASFMESAPGAFKTLQEQLSLIGFNMACNQDLLLKKYPDYKNHAYRHKLQSHIREMGIPPKLSETGGEFKWFSLNGRGFEKKVDVFGDGIGGGHAFMSRGVEEDGSISEVMCLLDIPFGIGGPDSDYDAFNANFMQFLPAIRRGGIFITHPHFDHASLEYPAKQTDENGNGFLKGVPVICREDVAYIIKKRLDTIGVGKENWPDFITYERPDGSYDSRLTKLEGDHQYAYCARDENKKARIWAQICAYGSLHTAATDMHAFTGCYGDEFYHDTYMSEGDSLGIRDHGWKFLEEGQLALAQLPQVSREKLMANIKNPYELYVFLCEITNAGKSGHAPTVEEFKNTLRHLNRAIKKIQPDMALSIHPFSTNVEEIRAIREICNEEETLRNTTATGTNMEVRDSCLNIHGVDPLKDLRNVVVPHDKLPQLAYDTALTAVESFIKTRKDRAAKQEAKSATKNQGLKASDVLASDIPYRVFQSILNMANAQQANGQAKPEVLYNSFFANNEHIFEDIAVGLGFPRAASPRSMPNIVNADLEEALKAHKKVLELAGKDPEADTTCFMLRSLIKNGIVRFDSKGDWNDTFQYQGIMAGQKTVSIQAGRSSKKAKGFRDRCGDLMVLATGVIGSAAEQFSAFARYARGESLYDYDEIVRNTGYHLKPEQLIFIATQTPSMGEDSAISQEALFRDVIKNRGNMVIRPFLHGFYLENLMEFRSQYEQYFRDIGWNPKWDGANSRLVINQPLHINGHGFAENIFDKLSDPRLKAKLTEAVHIPSENVFQAFINIVKRAGRRTSIKRPEDNVAMECRNDPKTGEPYMHMADWLTPSVWLIQIKRKFGQQYGGIIKMVLATIMRRTGNKVMDALEVRSGRDGYVAEVSAVALYNDWQKAVHEGASHRQTQMGPSLADIQVAGTKPMGRTASSLIHQIRWAGGRYKLPERDIK